MKRKTKGKTRKGFLFLLLKIFDPKFLSLLMSKGTGMAHSIITDLFWHISSLRSSYRTSSLSYSVSLFTSFPRLLQCLLGRQRSRVVVGSSYMFWKYFCSFYFLPAFSFPSLGLEQLKPPFAHCLRQTCERGRKKGKFEKDRQQKQAGGGMNEAFTSTVNQKHTEATTTAHGAPSLLIITGLFMNLLWLSYLVNYVLTERIWYEIYKVADCPFQTIDCQALSFFLSL